MIILPAIDLLDGQAVRLKQGVEKSKKVYSENPLQMALHWRSQGASMLHVVNLDGAFGRSHKNVRVIRQIVDVLDIPVQLGGGIKTLDEARQWLDLGIARVIFGTIALTHPEIVAAALAQCGAGKIVIGLDGRHNKVAIRGWQEQTGTDVLELARRMRDLGAERVIYTDVQRDGELIGPDIESTAELARLSGMTVIASGGFSQIEHFEQLAAMNNPLIEGAIVGTALYEGTISLPDLISRFQPPAIANQRPDPSRAGE
ncbi:1-(5-phosphoribosyl)-5-[(5-phosphoribosylamino)methylideneamino]imidazole-4-carboxamide isomerase [candidate division KSB1 bacterium]|nr:1-(5-phosphoribosyl)-5-[(5-phosphoribosylamino)methylideneamino]imidazole-4-carboxamide isomerase [candidate division KSB1 bacterium]